MVKIVKVRVMGSYPIAILILAVFASCGSSNDSIEPVVVDPLEAIPYAGITDIVTFADGVVHVRVLSESEADSDGTQRGERRYVGRLLDVEIMSVLWDGPSDARFDRGGRLPLLVAGWTVSDEGEWRPLVNRGAIRLQVGSDYVMPIIEGREDAAWLGESSWGLMSGLTPIQVREGRLVSAADPSPAAALVGLSVDDYADRLRAAEPDPLADGLDPNMSASKKAYEVEHLRYGIEPPAPNNDG